MHTPHETVVFTTNGTIGACLAALVLARNPDADVSITSPRHLPVALESLREDGPYKSAYVCGLSCDHGSSTLRAALEPLKGHIDIYWYAGSEIQLDSKLKDELSKLCNMVIDPKKPTWERIANDLELTGSAHSLLLTQLCEEANFEKKPSTKRHQFLHDLIHAANRRYFFFGDDSLNKKVIQHLAGLGEMSSDMEKVVEEYRQSPDVLVPLGSSDAMKRLRQEVGKMGQLPEPVLITGPTGSGKEVMARALHITSSRSGPFVAVNCAVLGGNPTLVEDRLFGHEKGAFTGAQTKSKGAFEEADGGTLFLDEIGELPADVQSQLLRVLEEGTVRPLGTMKTRAVNVRVIAATHRNLGTMVEDGTFREDLYYRLNVLVLRVPSLRERPEDMRSIAAQAISALGERGYPLNLSEADWKAIESYAWPGNVRQFLNVLKRAAYLDQSVANVLAAEKACSTEISGDCSTKAQMVSFPQTPEDVIPAQEFYGEYLRHALRLFGGNITRAANALGIAPNTLRAYTKN